MTKQQLLDSLSEVPNDATISAWAEGPVFNVRYNQEANRIELWDVAFELGDGVVFYEPVMNMDEVVDTEGCRLLYHEKIPKIPEIPGTPDQTSKSPGAARSDPTT